MAKMNFRARAKTLRRKMSDLAFDQSGDAGTPEDLIVKALKDAYMQGSKDTFDIFVKGKKNGNNQKGRSTRTR